MDWQQLITICLVALAAAYLARRTYRRWMGRQTAGCSACSGCDAVGAARRGSFLPADSLTAWWGRADRQGQRPGAIFLPRSEVPNMPAPSEIRLDQYLKLQGLVATGGQAKQLIQEGQVLVNGAIETRRRKKLLPGDLVECGGQRLTVDQAGSGEAPIQEND